MTYPQQSIISNLSRKNNACTSQCWFISIATGYFVLYSSGRIWNADHSSILFVRRSWLECFLLSNDQLKECGQRSDDIRFLLNKRLECLHRVMLSSNDDYRIMNCVFINAWIVTR